MDPSSIQKRGCKDLEHDKHMNREKDIPQTHTIWLPIPYALEPDPAQDCKTNHTQCVLLHPIPPTPKLLFTKINKWNFLAENPSLKSQMWKHGYSKRSRTQWKFRIKHPGRWQHMKLTPEREREIHHSVGIFQYSNTDLQSREVDKSRYNSAKEPTSESFDLGAGVEAPRCATKIGDSEIGRLEWRWGMEGEPWGRPCVEP